MGALSLNERAIGSITAKKGGAEPPVHAVAVTSDGYALRFSLPGTMTEHSPGALGDSDAAPAG